MYNRKPFKAPDTPGAPPDTPTRSFYFSSPQLRIPSFRRLTNPMGSEDKQRLGLGVMPNGHAQSKSKSGRLWIIPGVILVIYLLSRLLHPYSTSPGGGGSSGYHTLVPKNYLNTEANQTVADLPNPFEFCPTGGSADFLTQKYGASNLARTRLHLGSGSRVQRVLRRAMTGLPITISVLGGSISACHGAGGDPISPECWPAKFFEWWNAVFPHPATELTNGAMRRTDSSYYAFCHTHHVPDRTDLVILDFDAADSKDADFHNHFELLVRSLLLRPDRPAVVALGHFSPQYQEQMSWLGPETMHGPIVQFYDIPHISVKPLLYSPYVASPDSIKALYVDPVLANGLGHSVLADSLAAYFESQICQTWHALTSPELASSVDPHALGGAVFGGVGPRKDEKAGGVAGVHIPAGLGVGLTGGGSKDKVPNYAAVGYMLDSRPPPFMTRTRNHELKNFREVEPFCASANDLVNPLPPSLFDDSGWQVFHPQGSHDSGHKGGENMHYWYSTIPGSKLRIPVRFGAGDVGIYYMREPYGNSEDDVDAAMSSVHCWVDDNYTGAVPIVNTANVGEPQPALKMIDRSVARGSHNIECVLQGEEGETVPPFRILGIFAT